MKNFVDNKLSGLNIGLKLLNTYLVMLSVLCFFASSLNANLSDLYIDFDTAMEASSQQFKTKYADSYNLKLINLFKHLYEQTNFLKIEKLVYPKRQIPKIIHQIWVGEKPLPKGCQICVESWKKMHPEWEHILWTNEKVKNLKLKNQKLYDSTKDPVEKANILRYELLYMFGGVYIDADTKCLKAIDSLHENYSFYTGICPNDCTSVLANGVVAAIPKHPIVTKLIDDMELHKHEENRFKRNGVQYFSYIVYEFFKNHDLGTRDIVLPYIYFYPITKNGVASYQEKFPEESFSVHYWQSIMGDSMIDYIK